MTMSESFGRDGEWRLFMEREFAEPPATIQVLPKAGSYSHAKYGKFTLTPAIIQKFVDNHNQHVYQEQVPIDAEHQSKLSGAVGYYGEMMLIDEGRGGAEANVNWTDRGKELIASDAFQYFSPEWFDEWTDPATSKKIANVIVGGAITTRPFFKDKAMRPMVASEDSYQAGEWDIDTSGEKPTASLSFSAMKFTADEEDEDEGDKKKANIDVGDVHVNGLTKSSKAVKVGREEDTSIEVPNKASSKKAGGKSVDGVDDATKEFVEAQTKQLTEQLDEEKGLRKAAEERLVKLEGDGQMRRFTDVIMGRNAEADGSPPFYGKHETHHKTLALIAKEFGEDSEEFKDYVGEARATAKAMREGEAFKEVGQGSGPSQLLKGGDAEKKFSEARDVWMTAHPDKSKGDAVAAIAQAQPKLYTEYIREKDKASKIAPTNYGYGEDE